MKSRSRLVVMVWMTLAASVCLSAPSSAQKSDGAALAARIAELSRAGKYSEAIPLAQRQLESMEKTYGPDHREVAAALNNLALLYGDQGRAAEAEPLYKRSLAIFEKANGLDSPEIASGLNNIIWLRFTSGRNAMPMPSRCSNGRWQSAKGRFRAIIPTSDSP